MSTPTEQDQASTPEPENTPDVESLHTKLAALLDNITAIDESAEAPVAEPEHNGAHAGAVEEDPVVEDPLVEDHDAPSAAAETRAGEAHSNEASTSKPQTGTAHTSEAQPNEAQHHEAHTNEEHVPPAAVKIRGRPGGVLIEVGEGEWSELLLVVDERIGAAEGFFRGGRAVLEVGPRVLVEDDLRRMRSVLERHDMKLGIVRSTTERTLQAALELGLSTSSDEVPDVPPAIQETRPVVPITPPKSPYFVHHGTLRSGQVLRKAESIVIVGDVNPGAHVISAGDVMIWGKLRGVAHAGAGGDRGAVVAALDFGPTQLRIANVTAVAPEAKKSGRGLFFWRKPVETRPEVAHVAEGRIVVEPWDEKKSGRPRPLRRT